ncbi:MAG: MOSC domain-containing protein [Schumannella sp.]
MTLARLRRYPVKSCRGEDLESAQLERWGLAGDRRWMLVDTDGVKVTARETHVLLTVVPELVPGGLRLSAPGAEPLLVTEPGIPDVEVDIWGNRVLASSAGEQAAEWFSAVAGRPVRLVFLDDPTRRPVDPARSRHGDVVTFADAFPLLMASTSSLDRLNDWIRDGGTTVAGVPPSEPLDIRRFRPNLVIDGAEPFAEDTWSRIRIGDTEFRVAADCSRCVLTTVHPDTIERGPEPIATLSRHRKAEGKVWFAVDLIPELGEAETERTGGTGGAGRTSVSLRVGDPVEVLEANRHPTVPRATALGARG